MSVPGPEDPTSDSAMASGSDTGEPGGHLGPGDLSPDEERLLAALERDAGDPDGGDPDTGAPEADLVQLRAAEDGGSPPAQGAASDDALQPLFVAPGEDPA